MFASAGGIFVRDARLAMTYRLQFALHWIGIAASVVALSFMAKLVSGRHLGIGGMSYFDYALLNVAFLTLEAGALEGCEKVIRNDQLYGTLQTILATPTSLGVIALGSIAWSFLFALSQIACFLAFGTMFGLRVDRIDPLSLGTFVILAIAATVPLGILSTAMVIVFKQGAPLQFILRNAATILAGVLFPIALLPGWLQHVSWLLPMTHVLSGVRGAFNGVALTQLAPDALWLAAVAFMLLPVSLFTFRLAIARAKFDGTLSHY